MSLWLFSDNLLLLPVEKFIVRKTGAGIFIFPVKPCWPVC